MEDSRVRIWEDKKIATKSENADIAVLQSEMKDVKNALLRIETKVDSIALVQNEVQALKMEINSLKVEIKELKNSKTLLNWVVPFVASIITAAFTYLVIQQLGGK